MQFGVKQITYAAHMKAQWKSNWRFRENYDGGKYTLPRGFKIYSKT